VLFYSFHQSVYPQFEACTVGDVALLLCPSGTVLFLMSGSMEELSIKPTARGGITGET